MICDAKARSGDAHLRIQSPTCRIGAAQTLSGRNPTMFLAMDVAEPLRLSASLVLNGVVVEMSRPEMIALHNLLGKKLSL